MKKRILISYFAGAAIVVLSAIAAAAPAARTDDAREIGGVRYDPSLETVYEGTVASKGHVMDGLMYFPLRMPDRTVEIQIGPEEFVRHSGFRVKAGETVTVAGMPLAWNGRDIVLAREVRSMASILVARDRDGYPLWDKNRPVHMDPELKDLHLCETVRPDASKR